MIHEVSMANVICSRPLIVPRLQKQRGTQDFLSQNNNNSAAFLLGAYMYGSKVTDFQEHALPPTNQNDREE